MLRGALSRTKRCRAT